MGILAFVTSFMALLLRALGHGVCADQARFTRPISVGDSPLVGRAGVSKAVAFGGSMVVALLAVSVPCA